MSGIRNSIFAAHGIAATGADGQSPGSHEQTTPSAGGAPFELLSVPAIGIPMRDDEKLPPGLTVGVILMLGQAGCGLIIVAGIVIYRAVS